MSRPPVVIDAATLSQLLAQLLNPDTNAIREVEATLRTALVQPAFICDLFEILQHSPAPELRQLAAVLVRRRIGALWTKLESPVRTSLQAILLNRLSVEPERVVRRQMTSVVAVVARHAMPNGTWPELFGFLVECTRSAAAEHRELSMLLLASLLESEDIVDAVLRPHFAVLSSTLQTLLTDHTSSHVRQATLKAVGAWANVLMAEEELNSLQPLLGPMLQLCRASAQASDEESLCLAFEIFQEVLEEPSSTLIAPHLADLVSLALAAATEPSMEEDTRMAALNLVGRALENKRKLLVKQKLVQPIVAKLFEACASADDEALSAGVGAEDDTDDDDSVHRRAAQVMHTLGMSLPSKHAARPVLEAAVQFAQSQSAAHRRAGIIALAMTAEGFCEAYSESLPHLLPLLFAGCKDSVQAVREAACIGLGVFAQHLQPEIISHYQEVLPHIFMVRELLASTHGAPPAPCAHTSSARSPRPRRSAASTGPGASRDDDTRIRTNLLS